MNMLNSFIPALAFLFQQTDAPQTRGALMWQSASHAAGPSAFQILVTMLGVLIFVSLKDEVLA